MKEYIKEISLITIASLLIVLFFVRVVALRNVADINNDLRDEITYLESQVELYRVGEAWFEDFLDLIGEIYQQEGEIAVLEERIYWLNKYKEADEYNKEYADQLYEDLEIYLIEIIEYVEEHGNLIFFNNYFATNYRDVYDRILNIYSENHG